MNKLKSFLLFFVCSSILNSFAQKTDTNIVEFENNVFYHISNKNNHKLIIYLHGGVINPYFKEHNAAIGFQEYAPNFIHFK